MASLSEEKSASLVQALEGGCAIFVDIDPRTARCRLPAELRKHPSISLGLTYDIQNLDLVPYHEFFGATLSFNDHFYRCVVPWDAVWRMRDKAGHAMIWHQSAPPEAIPSLCTYWKPQGASA